MSNKGIKTNIFYPILESLQSNRLNNIMKQLLQQFQNEKTLFYIVKENAYIYQNTQTGAVTPSQIELYFKSR